MTPKLYIKPGCPWCHEAIDYLDQQGITYETIDVLADREKMREMIDLSGQSKTPTLDWDGDVLADFGVDELIPFLAPRAQDS